MALQIHQVGERSAVAISSNGYPTDNLVDLGQLGVVELDLSKVLDNTRWLGGAGNWHNGREAGLLALSADPCNSDLRRCDSFLLRYPLNLIHQLEVFAEEILLEAGQCLTEIAFGDVIMTSDLPC